MMGIRLLVVGVACTIAGLGTGCQRPARPHVVAIEGITMRQNYSAAIEIENFNGSVYVRADPSVKAPEVKARVRPASRWGPKAGELDRAVTVKATATIEGGERVLRVIGTPTDNPPKDVALDLYVRAPKVIATRIRNAGGPVELVGVSGPVNVENGAGGGPGGDVQVRTGEPMTEPATLQTSSGKVLWQVGAGSSGRFDLVSDSGQAFFTCRLGEVSEVVPDYSHYRGRLNNGENRIALRSGDGPVHALVIENAATHGPETWDGRPSWPSKPRILGRLGGYYNDEPARLFPRKPVPPAPAEPSKN